MRRETPVELSRGEGPAPELVGRLRSERSRAVRGVDVAGPRALLKGDRPHVSPAHPKPRPEAGMEVVMRVERRLREGNRENLEALGRPVAVLALEAAVKRPSREA